ncbi:MAG TPA: ATP-binding protein [Roseiflexaceae bacterium]|nr:ATP-binding protein [Roseiflexaceae bacterium]
MIETRTRPSQPPRAALRAPALWLIIGTITLISSLHYLTDIHLIPYHSIYRSLYYIPIAVAAVRYGMRGGALAALAIAAVYLPHVLHSWTMLPADGLNDLLETGLFLLVGTFAGFLADAERTQRQRAQHAAAQLADANARLHEHADQAERMRARVASILASLDSGVLTIDSDGRLTVANNTAGRLLGSVGWDEADLRQNLHAALDAGRSGFHQLAVRGRTLAVRRAPLRGPGGEAVGTVLVLDDITELRALEEQIQRAQRLASLGRLAGGLAHEIRNPLGIVRAAAQVLDSTLATTPQLREYTQVMQTEVDRVDRLIEQLLAYARPRTLQRGPVEPGQLVGRVVELTQVVAARQQVQLVAEVTPGLPPVEGDAELLHQALVNLVLNALQATPAGGTVTITTQLCSTDRPPVVAIRVQDTGQGITPDDLPRIFDPFFTTRDDGIGLGLSIVQQIVQEHRGTVEALNRPGAGAAFVVRLPSSGDGVEC